MHACEVGYKSNALAKGLLLYTAQQQLKCNTDTVRNCCMGRRTGQLYTDKNLQLNFLSLSGRFECGEIVEFAYVQRQRQRCRESLSLVNQSHTVEYIFSCAVAQEKVSFSSKPHLRENDATYPAEILHTHPDR